MDNVTQSVSDPFDSLIYMVATITQLVSNSQLFVLVRVLLQKTPALHQDLLSLRQIDEHVASLVGTLVVAAELRGSHETAARIIWSLLARLSRKMEHRRLVINSMIIYCAFDIFILSHKIEVYAESGLCTF